MHRTTVVLLKDGTTAPQGSKFQACGPGARSIKRASKSAFTVHVRITEDVAERRLAAWQLSSCEHLLRYTAAIAAMARPAPLWSPPVAVGQQANGNPSRTLPGYMRLVVVNEGLPPQVVRQTPPAPELSLVAVDEGR